MVAEPGSAQQLPEAGKITAPDTELQEEKKTKREKHGNERVRLDFYCDAADDSCAGHWTSVNYFVVLIGEVVELHKWGYIFTVCYAKVEQRIVLLTVSTGV
jgi:hypothetical protein